MDNAYVLQCLEYQLAVEQVACVRELARQSKHEAGTHAWHYVEGNIQQHLGRISGLETAINLIKE